MRSYLRYWVFASLKVSENFSGGQEGKKRREKKKKRENPPPTPQCKASEKKSNGCWHSQGVRAKALMVTASLRKKREGRKWERMKTRLIPGLKVWSWCGSSYTPPALFEGKIEKWIAKFWQLRKHQDGRHCAGAVCFDVGEGAESFKRS